MDFVVTIAKVSWSVLNALLCGKVVPWHRIICNNRMKCNLYANLQAVNRLMVS